MRNARNRFSLVKKKVSDTGPGILETFPVFPVSEPDIIGVFVGNRTMIDLFTASIADVGSPIKSAAAFFLKIWTGLVQVGQEAHLTPQSRILLQAFVFLQRKRLVQKFFALRKVPL